jgi:hypothetical protein
MLEVSYIRHHNEYEDLGSISKKIYEKTTLAYLMHLYQSYKIKYQVPTILEDKIG